MTRLSATSGLTLLFISLFFFFWSCRKSDKIDYSPSLKLEFSADTVIFDTVFTTVGTVTQRLMVYNNNDSKVNISSISLGSGGSSNYRINIDGEPSTGVNNVEISAHDSMFIFVRVTVDPTNQNLPLIISDSILFNTNGNLQNVKLVAWGQDAIFHKSEDIQGNNTWDSLKPHVIYGHLRIDTSATLTIQAGTKVYFHKDAYLAVSSGASLNVEGNLEHPVRFQGDRTDQFYKDLPGQWAGIYFEKGSTGNSINYAIIKNGINAISVDSSAVENPVLNLSNTIIKNMSGDGLYCYSTNVTSQNCVIGDCGRTSVTLEFGGSYEFRQLTIGNFWGSSVRNVPALYVSNYTYFTQGKVSNPLVKAYFGNAIVYGALDEEIRLDIDASAQGEYTFDHALMKTKLSLSDPNRFISCIKNQDPLFTDPSAFDYSLDTLSPAIDKGIPMGIPLDIRGNDRGSTPDLGAYERIN